VRSVEAKKLDGSTVALIATRREAQLLRHCVLEAIEALSDREFEFRVAAPKGDARRLLDELRPVARSSFWS
jgi:hypothetical protein